MVDKNKVAMERVEQSEQSKQPSEYVSPYIPKAVPQSGIDQFFTEKDAERLNAFNDAYINLIDHIDSVEKLLVARLSEIRDFKRELTKGHTL